MKRLVVWLFIVALGVGSGAFAQQPGEIFGKVTDASGAVMPGVSVTLTGPALLQPMTATSSATGTYRFPGLRVGAYTVKFELSGFKIFVRDGVRMEIGANVQINAALEISTVQETVTVTGETPVVDLRDTSKTSRFNQEALQSIPSARDPWVIIEQAAGIAMDRQNVGGSASGQQSNFVARGAQMREQKWNLDGIDVTDMSATGGSPVYYDFDAFEEMQISAGGSDVTMQSPGVAVNLVTKSGSDKLRGSGRFYVTDEAFQAVNVTDELRTQGAATGNPIQKITDYGFEAGGPIKRGKAWFWGSYGRQDINVGINNFFKDTADCQAIKKNPLGYSVEDTRPCLNPDSTLLNNYNAKVGIELFKNNQFNMLFNAAEKVRNARDASDLRPLETTYRQLGVTRSDLGSSWWKTGMPKTYKWSDRHIFSDRFMAEVSYAHVGNNFALTFHDEALRDVQPMYEATSVAGLWDRSYQEAVYVRPTDSIDILANYFLPGTLGGDHSFKLGFKYRNDIAHTESMFGGDAYVRYNSGTLPAFTTPESAYIYRRGLTEYGLRNRNFYIQDSYSRQRMTINVGIRYDYQTDYANPADVAASEMFGKNTFAGTYNDGGLFSHRYDGVYSGQPFNQLPALSFPGAKAGVAWKNFSPRAGLTYDLTGNGRNVVKFNYGRYVGQLGTGNMSGTYNTVSLTQVRYPWVDLNSDKFVQVNEIVYLQEKGVAPLGYTSGYNYNNPTQTTTTGKVDPNLSAEKVDELLFSFDKQIGNDIGVSASYIWRKYSNLRWSPTDNWSSANYVATKWTPAASACPAGATCPEVTYYSPTSQPGVNYTYTNRPDYWRGYQGFELSARKRMSKRWMMNASYSFNDAPVHYDSAASYQDPTNIEWFDGGQYAEESTSSGLGNVFVNAKWLFRASGVYQTPLWGINVAAFYNSRGGYPYIRGLTSPNRAFGAGSTTLYFEKRGDERLPTFQTVDFRVDKSFTMFNRMRITASADIFNLLNGNTTLSMRGTQNSTTANTISSLLAPFVARFGFRVTF